MPSSYTSSLRLTLPATGELAGSWGNTVNTGITELLDASVAGTTTISTWGGAGVAYTLSNNSGTADEARKMFIVATGAPGEAKNVICPAVSKLYVFRNDTTGGFTLTLKTPTGTGIAVPAGQAKLLYCDGTNVIEAVSSFGPLPALNASQAVFTDASKNLVSNAITGTGNVVMSTSPTMVTPTIGAATATSINKVTITAPATSATLTIANGKTLTANNSLTLAGTDATTMTFPATSTTVAGLGTTQTFTGVNTLTPAARTSGVASYFTLTTPADTGQTASTESIGANFTAGTRTWATGALATQRERVFGAPTYAFAGASTLTTAVNVDIAAPVAGTNATITNAYALRAAASQFTGAINATALTASQAIFTDANKNLVSNAITGSGNVVMSTSPTLTTPTLGAATATSINKLTITAPATSATLTVADGKTLTANNSLTLAGTDATTMTFPSTSASIARTDAGQTFTGTQTVLAAATQDAVAIAGRAGGTSSYVATLTTATLAASVTHTLPAITGTLATLANTSQTFAGAVTVSGAFTANGNITLGNANTDTITVGDANASMADGSKWKTTTTAANTFHLAAYDTDGAAYTNLVTLTAGTAPTLNLNSVGNLTMQIGGSTQATLDTSGNLGIGTSSPSAIASGYATVHVASTNGGGIKFGTTSSLNIGYAAASAAGVEIGTQTSLPLTFFTNNATRATLDSTGNLGLGVTPSAWASNRKAFQIGPTGAIAAASTGGQIGLSDNCYTDSGGADRYIGNTFATLYLQTSGQHRFFTAPSGTAGNAITFTQAMTLDASSNLILGGTTPYATFTVKADTSANGVSIVGRTSDNIGVLNFLNASGTSAAAIYNNPTALVFDVGGSERARIDSSGNFSVIGGGAIFCIGSFNNTTASAANLNVSSGTGLFSRSTSALKYKQDIRDLEQIDISKFRPVRYKSKCENDDQTLDHFGIIADEVDAAGIKELVSYSADGEVEGFQYERLTVVLVKAIQEQQAIIEQLKADVAALKGA